MAARASTPDSRSDRESELARALAAVQSRVASAAQAAGRNVSEIQLLPITKFCPATDVAILSRLGCQAVGESREQEASAKIAELAKPPPRPQLAALQWHMVGRIQRNKARALARWAHTAHSVDSGRLVTALDRAVGSALEGGSRVEPLRVYVQVSVDGDVSRGGVDLTASGALDQVCAQVESSESLELTGLMAVPPQNWDPDRAFHRLLMERDRVLGSHPGAVGLSAGMSNDLESAVKHGSTCVRVGTALLGPRRLRSP